MKKLKSLLFVSGFFFAMSASAQKVDSMFVHLYTDSLKKGTFNYINVDGLLAGGNWLPLDTSHVQFTCSHGQFFGNELWVDTSFAGEKINITTVLKSDPAQRRSFDMYIKKKKDDELLLSEEDILNSGKRKKKKDS